MVREDIIASAVSFLQDPSVASAPLEKRIAFLQSKNLTQEEIDISLARAEDPNHTPSSPAPQPPAQSNYGYRPPPPPPSAGYGSYPPGYWQPPPPPEPPKRDWRDYFIMATVTTGVGYALYITAKRYILPLISPPTPEILQQDKDSIDAQFTRAFTLLDQLTTDTTALKTAEESRTTRLDTALGEMESVLTSLKESSKRQGSDNRRIEDDVRSLRDLIPKALEAQKETTDTRLKELSTELKSLKTLVGNRMSGGGGAASPRPGTPSTQSYYGMSQPQTSTSAVNATSIPSTPAPEQNTTESQTTSTSTNPPAPTATAVPDRSTTPYSRLTNGRAAIPAWQMAAAKQNEEAAASAAAAKEKEKDTTESGTVEAGSS